MVTIPFLTSLVGVNSMEDISEDLEDRGLIVPITFNNWPTRKNHVPFVHLEIAHNKSMLFLQYNVKEQHVRAQNTQCNSNVWEDSCVEAFIAVKNKTYFNFEFNAIGTCFASSGPNRNQRELFSEEEIKSIAIWSTMGATPFPERKGDISWRLIAGIPFKLLGINDSYQPSRALWANFYKCGNKLTSPHYLSYKKIETPTPDFHRPDFFTEMELE